MKLAPGQDAGIQRPFAVYGGGHWTRDDDEWALAVDVGRALATAGFTVVTGGYGGAMEAVSEGAARAGGTAVGVLYLPVEEAEPNRFLTSYVVAADYLDRMAMLLRVPHALALPGGSGTLAELAAAAALLRRFDGRSLALWGRWWRPRVSDLLARLEPSTAARIRWVDTVDELRRHLSALST